MSRKSGRVSRKTESKSNDGETKVLSKVSIKISDFDNLENFDDEETELEISMKFKNDLVETQKLTTLNSQCEMTFTYEVDSNDESNVMNFFSNPVLITLSKQNDSTAIGHANIDLYPLCSDRIGSLNRRIHFEREVKSKQVQLTRKVSFKVEASWDFPVLRKQIANSVYVTFDSMYNLPGSFDDFAEITVGATIPLGLQLSKTVIFASNLGSCKSQQQEESITRWSNLASVSGKGSESPFSSKSSSKHENNLCNSNSQVRFNVINRIILSDESNKFFHDHLRKSLRLPVEFLVGEEHFFGLLDVTELLYVEKKHVQVTVPLLKFNNTLLTKSCNVQSAFLQPMPTSKEKKSKKEPGKKGVKVIPSMSVEQTGDKDEEEPFVNEDGQQVFIVVEVELEKPLNREVFEDCHEMILTEDQPVVQSQLESSDTFADFKSTLEVIVKNLLLSKDETDVDKVLTRMSRDGKLSLIEYQLMSQIPVDVSFNDSSSTEKNNDDFVCKLTSYVLDEKQQNNDDQRQDLLAQVFTFLGMETHGNEIFLRRIFEKNNEESWISYAVHCLRKEEFNKSMACVDKALTFNQHSIVAHILKAYVEFKKQKISESERIISFMQFKHGDSVELAMIKHLLKIPHRLQEVKLTDFTTAKFKFHHQLQQVYESPEVLWFATADYDKLLSWQDQNIKTTVFLIKLGCYDFAELALSEYYKTRGVNVNYSYLLAVIDAAKGDFRNALIHLNKISKQDVANHQLNYDKIIVLMSLVLMKTGKFDRVMKLLGSQELIKDKKPEYFLINFMLGSHLNSNGEHDKSLKLLIQSHRILPSTLTLMELGKCYHSQKKTSSAEKCFHQSISYDQDSRDAWLQLYNIYLKSNRDGLVQSCLEVLKL